mmetsp:Transcript_40933/g.47014  ORF Transcript_40933/g.47014 Transcript_40933/m.47014 type:complete len:161 (-) Transcript_40933:1557-2039(-)
MIFKKIALEYSTFTVDLIGDIEAILEHNCRSEDSPAKDLFRRLYEADSAVANDTEDKRSIKRKKRRDENYVIRDMVTALAVCHNVTPVLNNEGERELQASSPDEVALVKFSEDVGYKLEKRDQKLIQIRNKIGDQEEYEILECFPFSSESKRMGIVVRYK